MNHTLKSLLITSVLSLPSLMGANELSVDDEPGGGGGTSTADQTSSPSEHPIQAIQEMPRTTKADPTLAATMHILDSIRQLVSAQAGEAPRQGALPIHSIPYFIAR